MNSPVAGDPIRDPSGVVVEEVGDRDLVVVVGRVRKRPASVAVAERPDPVDVRAQLIVHRDEPAPVGLHADRVESEVVGVGNTADGEQQMRTDDLWRAIATLDGGHDPVGVSGEPDALGVETHVDSFGLEHTLHGLGDVRVVAGDEPRALLDHRHLCTETTVDLGELEPDVAPPDDDQMVRHLLQLQHARTRQEVDVGETGELGQARAGADVDENPIRLQHPLADDHPIRPVEYGLTTDEVDPFHRVDPAPDPFIGCRGDGLHPGMHPLHVHRRLVTDIEPELATTPSHVHRPRAGHECLGRHAAGVDACATETAALDDRQPPSLRSRSRRQRWTGLTRADHDRVVCVRHRSGSLRRIHDHRTCSRGNL
jgi:hypothetical protein